jgi:hypothetical protein
MFADQVDSNCHFPFSGWNYMTHHKALQYFPDATRISLHKDRELNLPILQELLPGRFEVIFAFNFISERAVVNSVVVSQSVCASLLRYRCAVL